ncbi:ectoine/hydroxyectoine ABC transporter permease subunit EhuD [Acetobacter fallax]|uniref:Ectoine/hydroxyectoine ABC transporter permease subunit EhuD n=1 Tax=Acetobacter fallax TaxID=1737473 RepID=A0ABX0KFV0_9PROT|nr:ectoine/hydroxyectoine ABC transporter permease subunit EhuD [Acetobacter fallax]NHO33993.1 ectoine/hydroxyectoine ABC transporter permease subunit EhuD [Acetobacter fallax]NHO37527.1 ectoine/hydroxyectoine ABC transporter permease subunit EhuD [Acetobacter fallax]
MTWDNHFIILILPRLMKGLQITLIATLCSFALAASLGLVIAILEKTTRGIVHFCVSGIAHFIRGTPLLVQLFFLYYLLPYANITLPALACGIAGLGIHYATYLSNVYRSGIEAIPALQWEACTSCNLTRFQTWRYIILPQAIRPVIPVIGNYFIALIKETPLLSSISVMDMMGEASIFGDMHYRYLEPITMVGVLFLVIGLLARGAMILVTTSLSAFRLRYGKPDNGPKISEYSIEMDSFRDTVL